MNRKE
jgi:transposase-like protein